MSISARSVLAPTNQKIVINDIKTRSKTQQNEVIIVR